MVFEKVRLWEDIGRMLMLRDGRREIHPTNQDASRNSRGGRRSHFSLTE